MNRVEITFITYVMPLFIEHAEQSYVKSERGVAHAEGKIQSMGGSPNFKRPMLGRVLVYVVKSVVKLDNLG